MTNQSKLITDLNETCTAALKHFGATNQLAKYHEETAELTVAITHGYSRTMILSEAADVIIMAWQMGLNASETDDDLPRAIAQKLERLQGILTTNGPQNQ
jgi:phosphoribosyl-ATP pyrophosphohydrolase